MQRIGRNSIAMCKYFAAGISSFDKLPHEDEYILDSNLVISYQENSIPGWNSFIDAHLKLGNKFYLLPIGISADIPQGFEILDIQDPKGEYQLNRVFEEIADEFGLEGYGRERSKIDIQMIAYAGYAAAASVGQLSDEAVLGGRVVFASNSVKIIKRMLNTKEKREKFDQAIRKIGFEHLINVRYISDKGTWKDFF